MIGNLLFVFETLEDMIKVIEFFLFENLKQKILYFCDD